MNVSKTAFEPKSYLLSNAMDLYVFVGTNNSDASVHTLEIITLQNKNHGPPFPLVFLTPDSACRGRIVHNLSRLDRRPLVAF